MTACTRVAAAEREEDGQIQDVFWMYDWKNLLVYGIRVVRKIEVKVTPSFLTYETGEPAYSSLQGSHAKLPTAPSTASSSQSQLPAWVSSTAAPSSSA